MTDPRTLASALGEHSAPSRLNATPFGTFAGLALALCQTSLVQS